MPERIGENKLFDSWLEDTKLKTV